MKLVDRMEMVNQEGIVLALIKIMDYDVVLYGAGESGYSTLRRLIELYNIRPICIIDNDEKKVGLKYFGIPVISPEDLPKHVKRDDNTYALLALKNYWSDVGLKSEVDAVIENAGINKKQYITWRSNDARKPFDDYILSHENKFADLRKILADQESVITLNEWIRCWLQADIYLLREHPFKYKYCGCDFDGNDYLYRHLENEIFVNCGSNIGDTIFQYIADGYSFSEIHAYEGNEKYFRLLQKNIELLPAELKNKIFMHNEYIGTNNIDVDKQFADKRITLINADIEGAEFAVLKGMVNIIKKQQPVIAFCVYHEPSDIIEIPMFVKNIDNSYKIYLRKYVHYDRNRWEVVMYAVPPARSLRLKD